MREQFIEYRDGDALLKWLLLLDAAPLSEECAALMNPFMRTIADSGLTEPKVARPVLMLHGYDDQLAPPKMYESAGTEPRGRHAVRRGCRSPFLARVGRVSR
jgi:hypothetical protein